MKRLHSGCRSSYSAFLNDELSGHDELSGQRLKCSMWANACPVVMSVLFAVN